MIDKVKIGGTDYKVIEMQESFVSDSKVCDGDISYSKAEIRVAKDENCKQYIDTVLLHEIVHGILYEFNIKIPEEEKFTEGFAKGLYQVLKDNPNLLENLPILTNPGWQHNPTNGDYNTTTYDGPCNIEQTR